jgi:hypothetical protein
MNRARKIEPDEEGEEGFVCVSTIRDPSNRADRRSKGRSLVCDRRARYEVDGKVYCWHHATIAAMQVLLKEEIAR